MGKYVALGDITVHKLMTPESANYLDPASNDAPAKSVLLVAGDSIDETEVPFYVREAVEHGRVTLLKLVSDSEAKRQKTKAAKERELAEQTLDQVAVQFEGDSGSSGPGRVSDVDNRVQEVVEGEASATVFISGDNSTQDGPVHESVNV